MTDVPRNAPVHGWRGLSFTGQAPRRLLADIDVRGFSVPARCRARQWLAGEVSDSPVAIRLMQEQAWSEHRTEHPVPHPLCTCGFRIVADRSAAVQYLRGVSGAFLAEVDGWGRACLGNLDDPPGTVRTSRFRVVGLTVNLTHAITAADGFGYSIDPDALRLLVDDVRARYAFPVEIVD